MSSKLYVIFTSLICLVACTPHASTKQSTATLSHPARLMETPIERHINFYGQLQTMTVEMQKKLAADLIQVLNDNKQDVTTRIQLATLYAAPNSLVKDYPKAQPLLQSLIRDDRLSPAESNYVDLIYSYILDYNKQQIKIKEENKKSDSLQSKYDQLQKKADLLEQKLNEMKNIEKSLVDRDLKTNDK
jgi:hypothetical protein